MKLFSKAGKQLRGGVALFAVALSAILGVTALVPTAALASDITDQAPAHHKTITDNGYDLGVDPWAPEWVAAVESEDTFCYVLPSWGYQFVVKPGAVNTVGEWALCQGPIPYVKGGTWLGIYKDSPNKALAWAFLEYCCLNSEAQQAYAAEYGEYVSLKSADAALAEGEGEEVLAGQNPFAFYNEQMEKLPADLMTAYDGTINNAFLAAAKNYATGAMSKDDAVAQFKADVANAYPELTIE